MFAWDLKANAQLARPMWNAPCDQGWVAILGGSPTGDRVVVACSYDQTPAILRRDNGHLQRLPIVAARPVEAPTT
ncbi:MAG: hypothetical protein R3F59_12980 [Myxococcota bacterium]